MRALRFGGALLLALVAGCATVPKAPVSTRLPMQMPYRLLLVSPDIQVRELTADGALSFRTEWADTARMAMLDSLRQRLLARTGVAVEIIPSEQAGADPATVAELHLRHDALGKMMPRPRTVGRTLGDAATKLGEGTKSELMFIMHADFTIRTAGRKTVVGVGIVGCAILSAALLGGADVCKDPDAGDLSAFASLIDAKTGDILWTAVGPAGFGDLRNEKKARKLAKALTKKLPDLKPVGQ